MTINPGEHPTTVNTAKAAEQGAPNLAAFTDEAGAALSVEVQRYQAELEMKSRGYSQNEVIVKGDVSAAIKALRPSATRESVKILVDWCKRLGFLFIGFTAAQFNAVSNQKEIEKGSVYWLVGHVALASAFLTASIVLDRLAMKASK